MELKTETASKESLIARLRESAHGGWSGVETHRDADRLERFVRNMLTNYSQVLGISEGDILRKIESRRNYWSVNYYQDCNFPNLKDVKVFETIKQLKETFPSHKFVCPACNGISTDPSTCNSGKEISKGKVCDWKSWGLFRTMGKGYRFIVKEDFLNNPVVHEIFMPTELVVEK